MKQIIIATDSHSGISKEEAERLGIMVLPMPFYFGEECYYEDLTITREAFFKRLAAGEAVSTSQPSPGPVMELWDRALEKAQTVLYMPISSGLSGSCETAMSLAKEDKYRGRVLVVDNGRVSALLHRAVLDACELVAEGYSAQEIVSLLEAYRDKMTIFIAVDTLEHLRKGGRISLATASLGTLLNIKPILRFDVGKLDTFKKCRGFRKAKAEMIEAMRQELTGRFGQQWEAGEVYLLAATSADRETTEAWVSEIEAAFPGVPVMCDPLSLGVCCHIGEGGLGIGCSVRPKRPAETK